MSGEPQSLGPVVGVVLAGGQSRRMGGDKALMPLHGRPLVAHAIDRLRPQVDTLILNANGDPARFAAFGLPVVADPVPDFAGPLAGILAGMLWARAERSAARLVATAATDTPFFPLDLVARLAAASDSGRRIAIASSGDRLHRVFGVFPVALAENLDAFIRSSGSLRVADWLDRQAMARLDFPADGRIDPFFNINTPDTLAAAEARLAAAHQLLPSIR